MSGQYGGTKIQTPSLDRLAAGSALFDRAYPEGLPTLPVRSAMFTGNHTLANPFFLYADSFDPHDPWDAPPRYVERYTDPEYKGNWIFSPKGGDAGWLTSEELEHTRNLYAAEAAFVDEQIGKLLDKIRELGLMENSLIIFLADHGHPLGEHGKMLKMVDQLYSPLLNIPLMIRLPGAKKAGKRIDALVQTVDLFPTIMEFLGFERENEFL